MTSGSTFKLQGLGKTKIIGGAKFTFDLVKVDDIGVHLRGVTIQYVEL